MLSKLFSRKREPLVPTGTIPSGQRVYAIGDIHGRLDLLDQALRLIEADDRARGETRTQLILLGDLIDRGPQSAQVVARALELRNASPQSRFLLGNHEEVFLKALHGDQKALSFFIKIGGRETILSYGISESDYQAADYPELLALLQAAVPDEHRVFLESFEDLIEIGDYAFVHAGVRPGQPLAAQRPSDLRWIRHEFIEHAAPFSRIIVHGHTITPEVEIRPNRIGIDTGAYASGVLTAMGFEGSERWLIQTGA